MTMANSVKVENRKLEYPVCVLIIKYFVPTWFSHRWFPNVKLSVLLPEGKRTLKRQLYSKSFTLREAASFIFEH